MKKLLTILLFSFLLNGYALAEQPAYVIDKTATAVAPWKVGEIVLKERETYRKFFGVTTKGHYVVQEFYRAGDVKLSDPFRLVEQKHVVIPWDMNLSLDGSFVTYLITGEKWFELTFENGVEQGIATTWYPNGQKEIETPIENGQLNGVAMRWYENGQKKQEGLFLMGEKVGIWLAWDEQGNLINEHDYGSAK